MDPETLSAIAVSDIDTASLGNRRDSDLVALDGGGYVSVYVDDGETSGTDDTVVQARIFDDAGAPVGPDFIVHSDPARTPNHSRVAALDDGGFVVVWTEDDPPAEVLEQLVFFRAYDADGTPRFAATQVEPQMNGILGTTSQWFPDVAGLSDGGFVISWRAVVEETDNVYYQAYTAGGEATGDLRVANDQTTYYDGSPVITALEPGGFAISWIAAEADLDVDLYARIFGADGEPAAGEFKVNSQSATSDRDEYFPAIAGLSNGGLAVGWVQSDEDPTISFDNVLLRVYEGDGAARTDETAFFDGGTSGVFGLDLAALSGGGVAAVTNFTDPSESAPSVQYVLADGDLSGGSDPSPVIAGAGSGERPRIAQLESGDIAVTWERGLLLSHIGVLLGGDPFTGRDDDDVLPGTEGPDTLTGGAGNDRLEGLGGDDELSGGPGSDGLLGGSGNDLILAGPGGDNVAAGEGDDSVAGEGGDDFIGGGPGNDSITGDEGDDTIGGGDGDDTIAAGNGDDVVAGGPGNDLFAGGDGSDTMGGSFGDDTVNGGLGNDSLGGGTGMDILDGEEGNDSLGGGEGNDVVEGGEGDDFLAGGGRNDIVLGGAGADIINGGDGNDTVTGGQGADVFVWTSGDEGAVDVILDFRDGTDFFRLTGVGNADGSGLQGRLAALAITDAQQDGTAGAQLTYQGQTIFAAGVSASDLGLEDFVFL